FGDDQELDDRQDEENDGADDEVTADDEVAEGVDDLAGVGLEQDEAGRGDVERQTEQGRDQDDGRIGRQLERASDVNRDHQHGDGDGDVEREQDVEDVRRQRDDHHADDGDDEARQQDV